MAKQWRKDRISRLAAALAYYTFISAAASLVILIALAAVALDARQVEALFLAPLSAVLGNEIAPRLLGMINVLESRSANWTTTALTGFALLFSAARAFVALQDALNTVWDADRAAGAILTVIKRRFAAFLCVSLAGLVLVVVWIGGTLLRTYSAVLPDFVGSRVLTLHATETGGSLIIQIAVFAMLLKVLPSVQIEWRDVALGAVLSGVLFWLVGRVLGFYVQTSLLASTYGAAGSFIALLFWFYLAAQILLLGAKFSQIYTHTHGTHAQLARQLREEISGGGQSQ